MYVIFINLNYSRFVSKCGDCLCTSINLTFLVVVFPVNSSVQISVLYRVVLLYGYGSFSFCLTSCVINFLKNLNKILLQETSFCLVPNQAFYKSKENVKLDNFCTQMCIRKYVSIIFSFQHYDCYSKG